MPDKKAYIVMRVIKCCRECPNCQSRRLRNETIGGTVRVCQILLNEDIIGDAGNLVSSPRRCKPMSEEREPWEFFGLVDIRDDDSIDSHCPLGDADEVTPESLMMIFEEEKEED